MEQGAQTVGSDPAPAGDSEARADDEDLPTTPDDTGNDVPSAVAPPGPGPQASGPVFDSAASDSCVKRVFDSLSPGNVQMNGPCSYRIPGWPQIADPKFVHVIVGEETRPLGQAANGWIVAEDGHSITLLGAACEAAKAGTTISVRAECVALIVI